MARAGSRFSPRHLLAVCTFLFPLGLLAWLGAAELRRQGEETQAMLFKQALAFLQGAERLIDERFDKLIKDALAKSEGALEQTDVAQSGSLAKAVRRLRESVPEILDLLLLDETAALVAPTAPRTTDLGLPMARSFQRRTGPLIDAVESAEYLAGHGNLPAAAGLLQHTIDQLDKQPGRRSGNQVADHLDVEVHAHMDLAAVEKALGHREMAREHYLQVTQLVTPQSIMQRYSDLAGLDLVAQVGIAELSNDPMARVQLMQEIADGTRDELSDLLLHSIMERLLAGVPEEAPAAGDGPEHAARPHDLADEARRTDEARRHGRAFAAEYNLLFVQAVHKRLAQAEEDRPVYYAFGTGTSGSLLAMRRVTAAERSRLPCSWVCLRLDLALMLAGVVDPFLEDDGRGFKLAVEDADGVSVGVGAVGDPPPEFDWPPLPTHGLSLDALPTDPTKLVENTQAAARNQALLMCVLFAVALAGAFWLWRTVSRARELAAAKVGFVSRVSHELKTPLALIRMYGETLNMGRAQGEGQVQRFGGIVAREADRLTTMIQRILDFSRQESGSLTYAPGPTDLAEPLASIAEAYRPHVEAKGANLRTDLEHGLVANVDGAALESAVVNLLENAIKYQSSEAPDPRIELVLGRADGMARIDVVDRGRGVPDAERHRIFDSFYRASNAGEVRGAGLGLSLVRHFAEAHGGRIAALPRGGGGSIFRLELPLSAAT